MKKEMNRRDFLRAAAVTGAVLLTGELYQKDLSAQEIVKIPEADKIVVTVITDNLADATRPHYKIARRPVGLNSVLDVALHAEHGLSYHVETVLKGQSHFLLFDFASEIQGLKRNIQLMNIDFRKIEALALSHDHWDHQAALVELLKAKREELSRDIPFHVGEQFFTGTYARRPDGRVQSLLALQREEIEGLGIVKIVENKAAAPIIPGAYFSGKVPQVTDYEKVAPVFVAKRGDQFVPEEFAGEQAVVLNAKGKGLVILSACAHRGIVNTVKHAQRMTGIEKVHAVIGGFHLTGSKPEIIQKTIADIKAIRPDYIVPTHCTGFEAITAFAREMPEQFILNTAGTKYIITE